MSDLLGAGARYTRRGGGRLRRQRLHAAARRGHAVVHAADAGAAQGLRAARRSGRTPTSRRRRVPSRVPTIQPCVYPNWDNTPRVGSRRPRARPGATPEKFRAQRRDAARCAARRPSARGATALGEVLERVGRGQPPRARPAPRPRLAARRCGPGCRRERRRVATRRRPLRIAMISYYLPSESKIGVGYQVHALANELVAARPPRRRLQPVRARRRARSTATCTSRSPARCEPSASRLEMRRRGPVVRTTFCTPTATTTGCGGAACPCTSARCTGRASRRRCTSAGVKEKAADGRSSASPRCSPAWWRTGRCVVSPQTRRWTPWVKTVIPNGVDTTSLSPGAAQPTHADPSGALRRDLARPQAGRGAGAMLSPSTCGRRPRRRAEDGHPGCPGCGPGRVFSVLGRLRRRARRGYRQAWVFCLPSSYEGFGIPYAEAMAAGLPVWPRRTSAPDT